MKNALLAAVFSTACILSPAAFAQQTGPQMQAPSGPALSPEADLEQHIGFLKSKLQITPAQEPQWGAVTAAMHADVTEYQAMEKKYPAPSESNPPPAPTSLQERTAFIDLRDKGEHRFMESFGKL